MCQHDRIIRTGRKAKWMHQRGKRTITCLDCGQFWLWNPDGNYFTAGGIVGGVMWAKLELRRKKIKEIQT